MENNQNKNFKTIILIVGIIVVLSIVGILIAVFATRSGSSGMDANKLVCKSSSGSLTVYYDDKTLTKYEKNNLDFDIDGQNKIVEEIGVKAWMEEFEQWFKMNMKDGVCEK